MRSGTTIYLSKQVKKKIEVAKEDYSENVGHSVSYGEFLDFLVDEYRENRGTGEKGIEKSEERGCY